MEVFMRIREGMTAGEAVFATKDKRAKAFRKAYMTLSGISDDRVDAALLEDHLGYYMLRMAAEMPDAD